jgi:glucosyl-3-phosphoglycerate phosphatase
MTGHGRLLLVRHARTAGNAVRRRTGREDVPLDHVGRQQADGLASTLQTVIPTHAPLTVHSSPLLRATQTIAPFAAARGLRVLLDPELVEMDFGSADDGVEPRAKLRLKEQHLYDPVPGGESLFQVWQRAARFFARVQPELASGGTVVVVAHYRISQLLAGVAVGRDFEADVRTNGFKPANASLFEVAFSADGHVDGEPGPLSRPGEASPTDGLRK